MAVEISSQKLVCKLLVFAGNSLTFIGCAALLLGVANAFDLDVFAIGLSSGIRVIGSLAIAGCLLSAVGYGYLEYLDK